MEEQKNEEQGYERQIGLQTHLKGKIVDTKQKVLEELSYGSVLIQIPEEMEVLKTVDHSPMSYLTLEGLTVKSDSHSEERDDDGDSDDDDDDWNGEGEDDWDGEQGVSVYGDGGEIIKYSIGASMITDGTSEYFFKTPMIYGNLFIHQSQISWKIDHEKEEECARWYISEIQDYDYLCRQAESEGQDDQENPRETIKLYYKWVESLKPQLLKILTELGVTEIDMDLPSEEDIDNLE